MLHPQSISGMGEELDREHPLFNQAIPVQVKYADHDKELELTVRVLAGTRPAPRSGGGGGASGGGSGVRESIVHVELTDEMDPYFLYTLQVGEDDYHQLKHDQRLRVDFAAFPQQFIELLRSCCGTSATTATTAAADAEGACDSAATVVQAAPVSSPPAAQQAQQHGVFLARLETLAGGGAASGGASCGGAPACGTLSIVEANHFKELTHLALRVRAGGDAAVKAYLAARLRQLRAEAAALRRRARAGEAAAARAGEAAAAAAADAAALREGRERDLRDLRAAHCAELTAAREEALRRAEAASAAAAAAARDAAREASSARASLEERLRAAETARDAALARVRTLEAGATEAERRAADAEAAAAARGAEVAALREGARSAEAAAFAQDKEVQRLTLRCAALEQQVTDARELAAKSAALQEGAEGGRGQLAAALEAYKANVVALQDKLEASVAEINRGNAIIQRIQSEHKALKSKVKLKSDVIRQQERLLSDQRDALAAAKGEAASAAADAREAASRAAQMKRELEAAEARVAEGARVIESNQAVITWLNKELNDAQLGLPPTAATTALTSTTLGTAASAMPPFSFTGVQAAAPPAQPLFSPARPQPAVTAVAGTVPPAAAAGADGVTTRLPGASPPPPLQPRRASLGGVGADGSTAVRGALRRHSAGAAGDASATMAAPPPHPGSGATTVLPTPVSGRNGGSSASRYLTTDLKRELTGGGANAHGGSSIAARYGGGRWLDGDPGLTPVLGGGGGGGGSGGGGGGGGKGRWGSVPMGVVTPDAGDGSKPAARAF